MIDRRTRTRYLLRHSVRRRIIRHLIGITLLFSTNIRNSNLSIIRLIQKRIQLWRPGINCQFKVWARHNDAKLERKAQINLNLSFCLTNPVFIQFQVSTQLIWELSPSHSFTSPSWSHQCLSSCQINQYR